MPHSNLKPYMYLRQVLPLYSLLFFQRRAYSHFPEGRPSAEKCHNSSRSIRSLRPVRTSTFPMEDDSTWTAVGQSIVLPIDHRSAPTMKKNRQNPDLPEKSRNPPSPANRYHAQRTDGRSVPIRVVVDRAGDSAKARTDLLGSQPQELPMWEVKTKRG